MLFHRSFVFTSILANACGSTAPGPGSDCPVQCNDSAPAPTGCTAPADCGPTETCEPDGRCTADVAFADSAGTRNAVCSREAPCSTIADAVATGRTDIRAHGTFTERIVLDGGRTVRLFADPGTTLTSNIPDLPVVSVAGTGTSLAIYDLTISGVTNRVNVVDIAPASGSSSLELHHVEIKDNRGLAISVGDGLLTMDRTTLARNADGGLAVFSTARVVVTNSLVVNNGSPTSAYGGIWVSSDATTHNQISFTTVYRNFSVQGASSGIACTGKQTEIVDSMFVSNGLVDTTSQATGNCQFRDTLTYPGAPPAGQGNLGMDPELVDPAHGDFHPSCDSPAIGAAGPMVPLAGATAWDLDGRQRACGPAAIGALQPAAPTQGP